MRTRVSDYHLMLKIMVTSRMMQNYQQNEVTLDSASQHTYESYLEWESRLQKLSGEPIVRRRSVWKEGIPKIGYIEAISLR